MNSFARLVNVFVRSLIVALSFIIDVKVKADVTVQAIKGQTEIERNHEILSQDFFSKLPSKFEAQELDVQTFDTGTIRFLLDEKEVALGQQSLVTFNKDRTVNFPKGRIFFAIPQNEPLLKIRTPQGLLQASGSEFLLEVGDNKTKVSVISGTVDLIDRAASKTVKVSSGYTSWLGGLLATGQHAKPLRPEACEIQKVMDQIKPLMGWTEKEFQGRFDSLKIYWKDAVLKVAEGAQNAVDSDIRALNQILRNEKDFESKKNHEQAKLRKLFKAKTVGMPGEGSENSLDFDRESQRDPASYTP